MKQLTTQLSPAEAAALALCEQLADRHPDAPITVATLDGTRRAPTIPATAGQCAVTLLVLSDAVHVTVARKGDTRTLWTLAVPFPCASSSPSIPDADGVGSWQYRAVLGADLESALLVAREQTGAAA